MNTNALKKFSQEARKKLLQQVAARLEYVLTTDSPELREEGSKVKKLKEELQNSTKEQLVDKVAYTWFNRFIALRFMDANDYQPIGVRIISPAPGQTTAELLQQAKQGDIPSDLKVNNKKVMDILDGRSPSSNPQNEAFKMLLVAACNHLHTALPFLFERINDYTELLLPDDLTSEFSIISDVVKGMCDDDCQEPEIIGWLYQFYISEKKDEVFASKSKVKKEDIPAATQLFTPRWIVEYMVQNTLGKLWLQNRPDSKLREHMPYFIESPSLESGEYLKVSSPEEIKLLDQACGSGHILVYGFDLLTKIYEEEGYNQSEIARHILTKNLYGFEIDERAAQLAGMALLMKARAYQRRLFKKAEVPAPNILCFSDLTLSIEEAETTLVKVGVEPSEELLHDLQNMQQATNFGSLILPHASLQEITSVLKKTKEAKPTSDAFLQLHLREIKETLHQLQWLAEKYHCVVDNPPYMGGGNVNKELSDFIRTNYPDSKADLMACFMEAGLKVLHPKGFLGMINQQSWMFLSSYEALRKKLIKNTFFDTLLHLGSRTFPEIGGEVVQNAAFTFWNRTIASNGVYIRLVDFKKSELKRLKILEATQNTNCDWRYTTNQKNFEKIPGSPISFWTQKYAIQIFDNNSPLKNYASPAKGMMPGPRFIRFYWEVERNDWASNVISHEESRTTKQKWYPYFKGGEFRKWYGNREYVVDFLNDGINLKNNNYGERNPGYYFLNQLNWTKISSAKFSVRDGEIGGLYDDAACQCPIKQEKDRFYLLAYLNSKISTTLLGSLSHTLNFSPGEIAKIPIIYNESIHPKVSEIAKKCFEISKEEWDMFEKSRDFKENFILVPISHEIEESYDLYQQYWRNKFFQLHKYEEELNRKFIEIYGLQEELTPDVPLKEITILKEEASIENGQLIFHADEVFERFVSYAVGCMFGRYSLDKEGLILANQGETLEDYLSKVERSSNDVSFLPDDDNIIPVLEDDWFEDDIVGRFYAFLKASFGEENFQKNLAFVEESLGKDIRRYFIREFYAGHIKRYKKRPIYWMFSSPKGSFNVLVYLHRYTPDTLNNILNNYLREFIEKLKSRTEHLTQILVSGSAAEQSKASKEIDKIEKMILDCQEYERDILYNMATERISIDLDDGVLVNYNKFGKAVKEVKGLNDKKTKDKVRKFDWIDSSQIR